MSLDLQEIPRIKTITEAAFLKNYVKPQKPVVIERLTADWASYDKWNFNYIKDVAGDIEIPLYDDRPVSSEEKFNEPHCKMKMGDYINLLKKEPTDYRIFLFNLLKVVPELRRNFTYPKIGLRFLKKLPFMFFGGEGSKVFMHYDIDLANILHFQFEGKKKCILFPPSETKYLYKVPFSLIAHEDIDFSNPDTDKWPALKKAKGFITHLNHGETLYMPEGYWHQMTYMSPGFSLSIRSVPGGVKNFSELVYNIIFMRYFDSFMRKYRGEKWITYKNAKAIRKTNKHNKSVDDVVLQDR